MANLSSTNIAYLIHAQVAEEVPLMILTSEPFYCSTSLARRTPLTSPSASRCRPTRKRTATTAPSIAPPVLTPLSNLRENIRFPQLKMSCKYTVRGKPTSHGCPHESRDGVWMLSKTPRNSDDAHRQDRHRHCQHDDNRQRVCLTNCGVVTVLSVAVLACRTCHHVLHCQQHHHDDCTQSC